MRKPITRGQGNRPFQVSDPRSAAKRGQISGGGVKGAMVRKAADQTADFSVATALSFDTEVYDTAGFHSNSVNPTRLTIPENVSYVRLGASVELADMTLGATATIRFRKNDSADWNGTAADVNSPLNAVTGPVKVEKDDYFDLVLEVVDDDSVTVVANRTTFWIEALA